MNERLAFPIWMMILIALIWAIVSFVLGASDAGAQCSIPYNTHVVSLLVTQENPPSIYAPAATNRHWETDARPLWDIYRSRDRSRRWAHVNNQ